jgi:hypothetical protein
MLAMDLNESLSEYEKPVDLWLEAAKKQVAAVTRLQKAVQSGAVRDVEKLRQNALSASESVSAAAESCPALDFDAPTYLSSGEFTAELAEAAERAGVSLFERDGVLFVYPVLVRPEPELSAVRIDKTLVFSLRPSTLAAQLKRLQARDPKARPERFLETLFSAYELVRGDAYLDVPLTRIYETLTLLPGSEKDYTLLDFTRDLYFLDISGVVTTKKGYAFSLPASTSTRDKKVKLLPFVDRQGREKLYATIQFAPGE